jgi:hypothetical protein
VRPAMRPQRLEAMLFRTREPMHPAVAALIETQVILISPLTCGNFVIDRLHLPPLLESAPAVSVPAGPPTRAGGVGLSPPLLPFRHPPIFPIRRRPCLTRRRRATVWARWGLAPSADGRPRGRRQERCFGAPTCHQRRLAVRLDAVLQGVRPR